VPGLKGVYGVSKDKFFYEPADGDLPTESLWSTEKYLRSAPGLFEAARDKLGWDLHLLHDVHHRLTPIEAGRLGKDLEPYRPFWMEDAVPPRTRPASASSASTPPRPWPWARSSTRSGTASS
jgi:mannonate dehydratase